MALTATPAADSSGLSEGTAYPVLGFTSSTVLVLDDDGKLQHISYAALDNKDLWSLGDDTAKAKTKPVPQQDSSPPKAPYVAPTPTETPTA